MYRDLSNPPNRSGASGKAVGADSADLGPDLQRLIDVWDTLPEEVKAELTAFAVDAAEISSKEHLTDLEF